LSIFPAALMIFEGEETPGSRQRARPKGKSTTFAPLEVIAVGCGGGIDELREHLDDSVVQWGLLRFQVGGGDFRRTKYISICCNGDATPTMARARLLTRTEEVLRMFGTVHASIELKESSELTLDFCLDRLLPLFISDHMDMSTLRQQYLESVQQTKRRVSLAPRARAFSDGQDSFCLPPIETLQEDDILEVEAEKTKALRRSRSEASDLTTEDALNLVILEQGPLNWVLFEPEKLEMHNAGTGGLEELQWALDDSKVLFGLLRLSFKNDPARKLSSADWEKCSKQRFLTKYVFIHWIGDEAPAMKRGQWNTRVEEAKELARGKMTIALTKTYHAKKDVDLAEIISELERLTVVQGHAGSVGGGISVEQYLAALAEEQERFAKEQAEQAATAAAAAAAELAEDAAAQEEAPSEHSEDELPPALDAILEVRNAGGIYDWVLVTPMKVLAP